MRLLVLLLVACTPEKTPSTTTDTVPTDSGAAVDTGTVDTDTGDPPPPEGCAVLGEPDLLTETDDRSFDVGGFTVTIAADGGFSATHADSAEAGRVLADTHGPTVSHTELEVEEHQGSFSVEETVTETCDAPTVSRVSSFNGAVRVEGAFSDCADTTFQLSLCSPLDGHLSFDIDAVADGAVKIVLPVASEVDEMIFGMGEQFPHDTLNLKGRTIPVLSQEGGIGRGHQPITGAVELFSEGSGGSEESTYYAAPHYLTSKDRSLFLENTEYAVFDFGDTETRITVYAEEMVGRVLFGDEPLTHIERFTEYAGRMPPLPDWANEGAVVALARPLDEGLEIVDDLLEAGVQIGGVWNQTWSGISETYIGEQVLWNWVQDPNSHPGWGDWVSDLDDRGIRTLCYINPMFRDVPEDHGEVRRNLFAEAEAAGYLVGAPGGGPYLLEVTAFEVGLLDFTNEAARDWMKAVITDEMVDRAGCSGWMADFAEALPFDAQLSSGASAAAYHNQYPVEWARLNREAVEEAGLLGDVLVYNRSGAARSPAHSLLMWQGDQLTTWDKYDGLVSAMHGLINGGFSGISLNHSDIGGYTSLSYLGLGYSREAEQLKRWTEMAAFTAAFRTHEGNQPGENAQVYSDDEAMAHFARLSKVYAALSDYRTTLFAEAQDKGWPVVRHLLLHYPDDPVAYGISDQFMLGADLMVAPIKNKCWTWPYCPYDKELYLPAGEWVHLWTGAVYGDSDGERVTVSAPIGEPAVFYRRGAEMAGGFIDNLQGAGLAVPALVQ